MQHIVRIHAYTNACMTISLLCDRTDDFHIACAGKEELGGETYSLLPFMNH